MNTSTTLLSTTSNMLSLQHSALRKMKIITPREEEVLHLIATEYSTKEIAQKLFISYETVHSHRKNLKRKLKASNAAGLVRVGFEMGILKIAKF